MGNVLLTIVALPFLIYATAWHVFDMFKSAYKRHKRYVEIDKVRSKLSYQKSFTNTMDGKRNLVLFNEEIGMMFEAWLNPFDRWFKAYRKITNRNN